MLLKEAETPLFEACDQSKNNHLSSVLMLLNAHTIHQVINIFQDELFRLLGCEILLENNVMPKSIYGARKLVSSFGLYYTSIHVREQGCILYRKENKDLLVCLICKTSRYVEGLETILAMWPNFTKNPRNLCFALVMDGMNPFGDFDPKHSTWPILLFMYNLPPWLVTKIFFVMLSFINPTKESDKNANIDKYIAPLIEELQELWKIFIAFDVSVKVGKQAHVDYS